MRYCIHSNRRTPLSIIKLYPHKKRWNWWFLYQKCMIWLEGSFWDHLYAPTSCIAHTQCATIRMNTVTQKIATHVNWIHVMLPPTEVIIGTLYYHNNRSIYLKVLEYHLNMTKIWKFYKKKCSLIAHKLPSYHSNVGELVHILLFKLGTKTVSGNFLGCFHILQWGSDRECMEIIWDVCGISECTPAPNTGKFWNTKMSSIADSKMSYGI